MKKRRSSFVYWSSILGACCFLWSCASESDSPTKVVTEYVDTGAPNASETSQPTDQPTHNTHSEDAASLQLGFVPLGLIPQSLFDAGASNRLQRTANFHEIVLTGTLTVQDENGTPLEEIPWSIFWAKTDAFVGTGSAFEVESNGTLSLEPGTYRFQLQVSNGATEFIGNLGNTVIDSGTQTLPAMSLTPVLGNLSQTVSNIPITELNFLYDHNALSDFQNTPELGIRIDGGEEDLFVLNPNTGTGQVSLFAQALEGSHTIELALYDGDVQKARSLTEQESTFIEEGTPLQLDLQPLRSTVNFVFDDVGSSANFDLVFPSEVVDSVGGVQNLQVTLEGSSTGGITIPQTPLTVVSQGADSYAANLTLEDLHPGDFTLTLTFSQISPQLTLGTCENTFAWGNDSQVFDCDISLVRTYEVSGRLLGVMGINVVNVNRESIEGARVYVAQLNFLPADPSNPNPQDPSIPNHLHFRPFPEELQVSGNVGGLDLDEQLIVSRQTFLPNDPSVGQNQSYSGIPYGVDPSTGEAITGSLQPGYEGLEPTPIIPQDTSYTSPVFLDDPSGPENQPAFFLGTTGADGGVADGFLEHYLFEGAYVILAIFGEMMSTQVVNIDPLKAHNVTAELNVAPVKKLAEAYPGDNFTNPTFKTEYQGNLYFSAEDGIHGVELWRYNPGLDTMTLVSDLNLGAGSSNPRQLTVFNGKLYFSADDGTNGRELWVYDSRINHPERVADMVIQGTVPNQLILRDYNLNPNSDYREEAHHFTIHNGNLVFTASEDGINFKVWSYDGAFTLEDLGGLSSSTGALRWLTSYNGTLYASNGGVVHSYNGTDFEPTFLIGSAQWFLAASSGLYFKGNNASNNGAFFRFDGTTLHEFTVGNDTFPQISWLVEYDGDIYFSAWEGTQFGRQLWKYDTATDAIIMVTDIPYTAGIPGNVLGFSPRHLTVFNETLYFRAASDSLGTELWYDEKTGTDGHHFVPAIDFRTGKLHSDPSGFTVMDGRMYMSVITKSGGNYGGYHLGELWVHY